MKKKKKRSRREQVKADRITDQRRGETERTDSPVRNANVLECAKVICSAMLSI